MALFRIGLDEPAAPSALVGFVRVDVAANPNLSAVGAGAMAGIASGTWTDEDAGRLLFRSDTSYAPRSNKREREAGLAAWRRAVERARGA